MTLDRLLGRIALIGSVSVFGYNCDSSSPDSCVKDTDCKGERVCENKVCVDMKSNPSSTSTEYTCKSYVYNVVECCEQGKFPSLTCNDSDYAPSGRQGMINHCNQYINNGWQCILDCEKKNKLEGKYCDYNAFRYCDEKVCKN